MPAVGINATWGREDFSAVLIEGLRQESALLAAGATLIVVQGRTAHIPRVLVDPEADWVAELAELPSNAGDADVLERAGLPRVRFHDLRHHFGSGAITRLDAYAVQSYMGHQHYSTTQRYLHHQPRPEDARRLADAFRRDSADRALDPSSWSPQRTA